MSIVTSFRNLFVREPENERIERARRHNNTIPIQILVGDAWSGIAEYLSNRDICNLMQTCRYMRDTIRGDCYFDLRRRMGRVIINAGIFQFNVLDNQQIVQANAVMSARASRNRYRTEQRQAMRAREQQLSTWANSQEVKDRNEALDMVGDMTSITFTVYSAAFSVAHLAGWNPAENMDRERALNFNENIYD